MNRYKILAVSFALVLVGILVIQAYWVNSVIDTRNKQFDAAVFSSLQSTIAALEQKENITFISKVSNDTIVKRVYKKSPKKSRKPAKKVKIYSGTNIIESGDDATSTYMYQYSITNDSGNVNVVAKSGSGRSAGAFVFSSDSNVVIETEDLAYEPEMENKLSKIDVLIQKIAAGKADSVPKLPAGEEVEKILGNALAQNDVDIPFGIGMKIRDSSSYTSASADTGKLFSSIYKADIFPNDVLKRKGLLYVEFPGKNTYIFSEMMWLLVSLLLFTLLIIFMFYSTLANFRKQKKLNELKSDFINNMTHELKTPLATIQLASDVIMKHALAVDPQIGQMATTIKKQSKRMDEDVKNILQIALLENPASVVLQYSDFSLKNSLQEIADSFQLIATEKQLRISINYDGSEQIFADKDLLEKALCNLIDNAVKYSNRGGEVAVQAYISGVEIKVLVSDTGKGVNKEDLPFVFDKFYRAGKGDIHYNKGYGLGLSFVKRIAELHKGSVILISEKNKGTVVTLTIPKGK
ncbi:MAG TPA: HAMP domain-containing sensor histidine kinase [Bacteroidia bacterium]